ncbi:hypothetical protein ACFODL_19320 [Phenylobacterium terrae]|uniref:Glycosyltransferase RgtA/B/C/D-like domain-containing protein n=1 Tax=Phenylobacterium terrae TaxID=2665495 RepID=A0ABW4N411_9CAUL
MEMWPTTYPAAEAPPEPAGEASRSVRLGLWVLLAAYVGLTGYIAWRTTVLQPYSDMYDWVFRYLNYREGVPLDQYLLIPHNFHRLVTTFGLMDLDVRFFGASNLLIVAVTVLAIAGAAAVLGREAARAAPPPLGLAAGVLAAMFALLGAVIPDATIHINAQYVHTLFFVVVAIALAEPENVKAGLRPRHFAALLFAAAAPFGNGVGLAVWPVLIYGALRSGQDRRWLAILAAAAVVYIGLYVRGQSGTGAKSPLDWSFSDFVSAVQLALSFLGLPWTRVAPAYGWVLGLGVAAIGSAIVLLRGGPEASRGERLASRLVLYSLGAALMAALGRTGIDEPSNVSVRYQAQLVPLHAGFVIFASLYAARAWRARPQLVEVGVVAAAGLMLAQQAVMGASLIRISDAQRQTMADFKAGLESPEMLMRIHPDLAHARTMQARMDAAGLYQRELHLNRLRPPR